MAETLSQRVRKLKGEKRNGKCPHCPRKFDAQEQLAAHVAREHASEYPRPSRRTWSLATAVGIVGGVLGGVGLLVVFISSDFFMRSNVAYTGACHSYPGGRGRACGPRGASAILTSGSSLA